MGSLPLVFHPYLCPFQFLINGFLVGDTALYLLAVCSCRCVSVNMCVFPQGGQGRTSDVQLCHCLSYSLETEALTESGETQAASKLE